jgi:hypothetical protein
MENGWNVENVEEMEDVEKWRRRMGGWMEYVEKMEDGRCKYKEVEEWRMDGMWKM